MARQATAVRSSGGVRKPARRPKSSIRKLLKNPKIPFAVALLFADAVLVFLIIAYVPYTKIDWDAYMSQVSGFLGGERDYSKLKGDTGPLVYPAGFLYIYSAIQYITGGEVYSAQILFGFLYVVNLGLVLFIYLKTDVHSGAVSVKMNVLLYAPPLLILLLKAMDIFGVITSLAGAALVQILLGLPFILSHPMAYVSRAFNLGRVFIHFWSVNFKFVPEPVFISRGFALLLLAAHLILLAIFAHYRWCRHEGGMFSLLHSKLVQMKRKIGYLSNFQLKQFNNFDSNFRLLTTEHIATTMFIGNFIGIVCARSLHYQFYSCVILFAAVEICWNIYPSNTYSSLLLLAAHLAILGGLWSAPPDYPYADGKSANIRKDS
ncbi:UNVERIFIED_CONTAM: Dol-P-Man:Man(5)GlcNAc(2)-PP-Dol alpha-1,3-mannosyltransferase [Sesamum radiatum]|uniref:dolichyl-P-Man:Man5GlcNAc2-PP-dolichol alpha-1,3-mannosyltransferase n=1 Tax=Sesamum radiatum TaxID=300843 RepID=A0AAW2URA7_SESRA